jgi:hypothetical protein
MAGTLTIRAPAIGFVLVALGAALSTMARASADQGGVSVRLAPPSTAMRVGDGPFEVDVLVDGINHHFVDRGEASDGLGVYQFALHFNPNVVQVTHMEGGPFMASTGRSVSCFSQVRVDDPSIFDFGCVSTSPPAAGPQGSGMLARLTLRPVATDSSSSELTLDGEMGGPLGSTGDEIAFKWVGGRVTVAGATATPEPTNDPVPRGRSTTTSNTAGGTGDGTGGSSVAGVAGDVTGQLQGSGNGFPVAGSGSSITESPNIYLAIAGGLIVGGATLVLAGRARERRMRRRA